MGAIIKACNVTNSVRNTGKECDTSMLAPAMLIAIQKGIKFSLTDLEDPVGYFTGLIQARQAFPLFGQAAPVRGLQNAGGDDVTITLDDGLEVFVRYAIYSRVLETTSGGLCYAQALQSFLNSGYSILEIDQTGQMQARKNSDGTFSGLYTDYMSAPSPILPDLSSTVYKNRFKYSYSPVEIVNNGIIFKGAEALLSLVGLIDTKITAGTGTHSTTKLYIKVDTECKGDDLVEKLPLDIIDVTNFIVTNKATGAVITPSAGAVASGEVELTGVFASGQTFNVIGSAPSVWASNDIEGYDASETSGDTGADITIP